MVSENEVTMKSDEPEGWCFDCEKPVAQVCVEEEHAYRLAVSPEEYEDTKD
jgi:hypothetical protein